MSGNAEPSRAEGTRARLLAAALDAFAEKGFHGTTTRDIAATAGMSPAALYVHHKSKEELLYLITLTGNQTALARLQASIAASEDPVVQLHHAVRDFAEASAEHHTITRVINQELAALTPAHRAEIRALRQQIGTLMRRVIQRGVDAGDFHVTDADITATAIMSLGIDVARWYRQGGTWTPRDVGEHYAEMATRMLGVDPARTGSLAVSAASGPARSNGAHLG